MRTGAKAEPTEEAGGGQETRGGGGRGARGGRWAARRAL